MGDAMKSTTEDRSGIPTLEELPEAIGFPYTVMPTGWFQVEWSHALRAGDVKPLHYFEQHLVLYRSEAGEAVALTAFCPHFGAHLGHGGRVDGCNIVCPYHGWVWGPDGYNVLCPATGEPSRARRRIRKWAVAESNGVVWLWHDALGRQPLWEAPAERRHEQPYLPVSAHTIYKHDQVRLHPQFTMENVVDVDHLIYVHGNTLLPKQRSPAEIPETVPEGPRMKVNYASPGTLNEILGVGVVLVEFPPDPERPWRAPCVLYACTTPIDDRHSDVFGTVLVCQDASATDADALVPAGSAKKRVDEQIRQNQVDFFIWKHMVYMRHAPYSPLEGKLLRAVRQWAQQFYPEGEPAPIIRTD
jgi:3-ketosteroid 9alpha-monooxygenase subunit A